MDNRSKRFFSRPQVVALALAVPLLGMGATSASAQWFGWDSALPPMQVERMIQASGYRLTGPVIRNGRVYLANVLGRDNDLERLVLDADDGRLLQRYRAGPMRRRFASGDWSDQPRPQPAEGFLDRLSDFVAPPRPPADFYGEEESQPFRAPPGAPTATGNEGARADEKANPNVILAPSPALEKPRAKPQQVKRKKPESTAVAQPTATPGDAKPATAPDITAPVRPDAAVEPTAPAPRVADTKAAPGPAPATAVAPPVVPAAKAPAPMPQTAVATPGPAPVTAVPAPVVPAAKAPAPMPQTAVATPGPAPATAVPAPVVPAVKAPAPKPAVNDVPVAPLE